MNIAQYRDYPLHLACAKVLPSVVNALLEDGADVNLLHKVYNETIFFADSTLSLLEILIALGRAGAVFKVGSRL